MISAIKDAIAWTMAVLKTRVFKPEKDILTKRR